MTEQRFRGEVKREGGSAYLDLRFDVPTAFGTKGRVSLKGTIKRASVHHLDELP